jgi:hypothetical protein
MRRFTDAAGRPWDVVVGRESWGTLYALFIPAGVGRAESIRQALLRSESYEGAQLELDGCEEATLARLFEQSEPKTS